MKLSKLFGIVLSLHLGLIAILLVQPGCSTTQPPTRFDQGGVSSMNQAQSLDDVLPDNTANTSLDSAFNEPVYGTIVRAEPQRPLDSTYETESMPTVEVSGEGFSDYTVAAGDSMWAIAKKHAVSLKDLLAANDMGENDILRVGRVLRIPSQSTHAKVSTVTADVYQPSGFNAATTTYEVVPGDTLGRIAKQYGTSVKALKAANNKTSDLIRVGEQLLIPVNEATAPQASAPVVAPADPVTEVKPADPAPVKLKEVPSEPVIEPAAEPTVDTEALFEQTPEVPVIREGNP